MISIISYSDVVLQHFHNPQHFGSFPKNDIDVRTGVAGSASSGDVVRLQIRISDGVITDACFKAQGTCATIAVASWVTTWIIQKSIAQCQALTCAEILDAMQLSPLRKHSALLVLDALQFALR